MDENPFNQSSNPNQVSQNDISLEFEEPEATHATIEAPYQEPDEIINI